MNADEIASDRPETTANPAANALVHGFCASKILAPETLARAELIRAELTAIHQPWSTEEIAAVDQLAIGRAQQIDVERAMRLKVIAEKSRAVELFERAAADRLHADLGRFRESPAVFGPVLGLSWHGAEWLKNLWARIRGEVTPDPAAGPACLPFAVVCDAAAALGSPWQVDQASPEAARFMALAVRIAPEPNVALDLWIDRSNAPDGHSFARSLANRHLARTPADPRQAAAELATTAAREFDRWSLRCSALRSDYETARDTAAEAAVGTGSGDPALEREFRLLSRYLTSARNRADRLERRLDILKKERVAKAWRAQREAQREARRLRRESEKARGDAERAAFHAMPDDPVYETHDWNSRKGEFQICSVPLAPAESNTCVDESQTPVIENDTTRLRNGTGANSDAPGAWTAADAGERSPALSVDGNAPFRDRMRMIRHRRWDVPAEVQADEADFLVQLERMPDSFERDLTIRAFFGSVKTFRRCWTDYRSWADREGDGAGSALG